MISYSVAKFVKKFREEKSRTVNSYVSNVGMSNSNSGTHPEFNQQDFRIRGASLNLNCRGFNKKSRSHRSAADGVVAHTQMLQNAFRGVTPERPPRPRLFGTGPFFWWRVHP